MANYEYRYKVEELFSEFFKEHPKGDNRDLANFMFERGVLQGKSECGASNDDVKDDEDNVVSFTRQDCYGFKEFCDNGQFGVKVFSKAGSGWEEIGQIDWTTEGEIKEMEWRELYDLMVRNNIINDDNR